MDLTDALTGQASDQSGAAPAAPAAPVAAGAVNIDGMPLNAFQRAWNALLNKGGNFFSSLKTRFFGGGMTGKTVAPAGGSMLVPALVVAGLAAGVYFFTRKPGKGFRIGGKGAVKLH